MSTPRHVSDKSFMRTFGAVDPRSFQRKLDLASGAELKRTLRMLDTDFVTATKAARRAHLWPTSVAARASKDARRSDFSVGARAAAAGYDFAAVAKAARLAAQPSVVEALTRGSLGVASHPLASQRLVREARPVAARAASATVKRLEAAAVEVKSEPIAVALLNEVRGLRQDVQGVERELNQVREDQRSDSAENVRWQQRTILVTIVCMLIPLLADHPPEKLVDALDLIMRALTQQLPPDY